MGIYQF